MLLQGRGQHVKYILTYMHSHVHACCHIIPFIPVQNQAAACALVLHMIADVYFDQSYHK